MTTPTIRLQAKADIRHGDAADWYDGYGWHLPTIAEGQVELGAVRFGWLDDRDDAAVRDRLVAEYPGLTLDEAYEIVAKAREIREAAEDVVHHLEAAIAAWHDEDGPAVVAHLEAAAETEMDHGDDRWSRDLRRRLVEEVRA